MMEDTTDPNCAICGQPSSLYCSCEALELENAVMQAEKKMLNPALSGIREWVKSHARDCVLAYYKELANHRAEIYVAHVARLTEHAARVYNASPNPDDIAQADADLKRNIDEDWKASVQRYPDVLEYFYGMVDISLPHCQDRSVKNPPFIPSEEKSFAVPRDILYREVIPGNKPRNQGRRSEKYYSEEQRSNSPLTEENAGYRSSNTRPSRRPFPNFTEEKMDSSRYKRARDRPDEFRQGRHFEQQYSDEHLAGSSNGFRKSDYRPSSSRPTERQRHGTYDRYEERQMPPPKGKHPYASEY